MSQEEQINALGRANAKADYNTRKGATGVVSGAIETTIGFVPGSGTAINITKQAVKFVAPIITDAITGSNPDNLKKGNAKSCSAESLVNVLAGSDGKTTPKIITQQESSNNIFDSLFEKNKLSGSNPDNPNSMIKQLKLELRHIDSTSESDTKVINFTTNTLADVNTLLENITTSSFYKKINKLNEGITPETIQELITKPTGGINELFILLINLLLELQNPKNTDITEFNQKEGIQLGTLTSRYMLRSGQNNSTRAMVKGRMNDNIKRLLVLQEMLIYEKNNMFVPLKNVINSLLFLSIQDIKRVEHKLTKFKEDVKKDHSNAIKSVIGFIIDEIKNNKEELIKIGINKLLDNEIVEKVLDVATTSEVKTAGRFLAFLRKKPGFDLHGISNSKEGSKLKKFFNRRELANYNFVETYSRYLALILVLNTSKRDYEQLRIATDIFNEYMYTTDCSTKLRIENSLAQENSETTDNINIYNGKLILEFTNGYTITVSQTGILTHILPNLISGLFTDLYKYITTELVNPDNELIHKFKSQLLNFGNFNRKDNLCKISLLAVSNYLYPLYNMFYRTLLNLYVPINFDSQVIENSEDLIMSNPKLSSYDSGSNQPYNIWDEDTKYNQQSLGPKTVRQLATNYTLKKIRTANKLPSYNQFVKNSTLNTAKALNKTVNRNSNSNITTQKVSNKESKQILSVPELNRPSSYEEAIKNTKKTSLKRTTSYKEALKKPIKI